MKTLVLAMFVSLVSVFASVAYGSTLTPGAYLVTGVGAGAVALMDTDGATHMERTGNIVPDARAEGATYIVLAPMTVSGRVDRMLPYVDGASRTTVYRGEGRTYVGTSYDAIVMVRGEIDAGDAFTIGGVLPSRCESVGPRLDGTYVTICDGLVMSVDDGHTTHLAPFGAMAGNTQVGTR